MGILVPLILGGIALTGLPWLIHRIRRPSQNPTPFSSLMFLPETVPPIRKKRRIEHPWLMAVRMGVLVLLAVAFARPYTLVPAAARPGEDVARLHVLLIDSSLGTTSGERHTALKAAALARLTQIDADPVAVVTFGEQGRVLADFDGAVDARTVLEGLAPSHGGTNFVAGLQQAERLLSEAGGADTSVERIIHVVSDLQHTGFPEEAMDFALAQGIAVQLVPLAPPSLDNAAVEAAALEARAPDRLIVRARLRNYGATALTGNFVWELDGAPLASQAVSLSPESSLTVSLSATVDLSRALPSELRLDVADTLPEDNDFQILHTPEPIRTIGVIEAANASSPGPFLEAALAESQPVPWTLRPLDPGNPELAELAALVVIGLPEGSRALAEQLAGYVAEGGRMLLLPTTAGFPEGFATTLLGPVGIVPGPARFEAPDPDRYALFGWIDYDNPAFRPFRAPAYSDFTALRFMNHFRLQIGPESAARVAARFDGDGDPAMVVVDVGPGRIVLWAFPLDATWSNIVRSRRFVPLLHETIGLLLPELAPPRQLIAGITPGSPPDLPVADLNVMVPGEEQPRSAAALDAMADGPAPGFIRWYIAGDDGPARWEPVNIPARESDPRVMTPDEFLLRVGVAPTVTVDGQSGARAEQPAVVHWEHGYSFLILAAVACAVEALLAWIIAHRRATTLEPRGS